jgi:hypothetical protein
MDEPEDKMSLHALHERLKPIEELFKKYELTIYRTGLLGIIIRYLIKLAM